MSKKVTPTNASRLLPEEIRAAIAKLQSEGLIAATGTTIEPYKTKRYTYYRLCDSQGRFLIHLGNKDSQWYALVTEAVKRRKRLNELKQMLKEMYR